MTFLLISFIAGVLTVLAPCILPLLPVIIGGSISDGENRHKSSTIIISLIVSIVLFTLILKFSTAFVSIPPIVWKAISGGILILFGLTATFPGLWERLPFVNKFSVRSNKLVGKGMMKKGMGSDILIGAALGPVFSSCSPTYFVILATVLPVSFGKGVLYLVVYALGLGIMLLLISRLGQRFTNKLTNISDPRSWFKRGLGVLFILVGIFVLSGLDKKVQSAVVNGGFFDVTKLEITINERLNNTQSTSQATEVLNTTASQTLVPEKKKSTFKQYREIMKPGGFINTNDQPITIGQFIGKKVILIDFVTYSCINCQRTFPYLTSWYDKYNDKGLQIIAIHTPEFAFEHKKENVQKAFDQFGLKFPAVLDNDYGTWNAWGNQYWPRKYLIDIDGYVVYDHIGEGNYAETEQKIVDLLNERNRRLGQPTIATGTIAKTSASIETGRSISPETYLGSFRADKQYGKGMMCETSGACTYESAVTIPEDSFSLSGKWKQTFENLQLESTTGSLFYHFTAGKVHLVAESGTPTTATVYIDGEPISATLSGNDVRNSEVTFADSRLYTLVDTKGKIESHMLELRLKTPGFKGYAFTFGN